MMANNDDAIDLMRENEDLRARLAEARAALAGARREGWMAAADACPDTTASGKLRGWCPYPATDDAPPTADEAIEWVIGWWSDIGHTRTAARCRAAWAAKRKAGE
jgi:hypothetical protein